MKVKQEGQKPTMETQGPPPPPTSQYYIHPPYMTPGPFGFDPAAHSMYRNMNMMVPGTPYNTSPYHLQMGRFHAPEDLSRNQNAKALDILQHHANQYYNPHKIHELSERALKSPTSNVKVAVSSPGVSQQPPPNNISSNIGSTAGHGPLPSSNLQPPPTSSLPPGSGSTSLGPKGGGPMANNVPGNDKLSIVGVGGEPGKDSAATRISPPPQRHVHTHHHTHVGVGLGYPYYGGE